MMVQCATSFLTTRILVWRRNGSKLRASRPSGMYPVVLWQLGLLLVFQLVHWVGRFLGGWATIHLWEFWARLALVMSCGLVWLCCRSLSMASLCCSHSALVRWWGTCDSLLQFLYLGSLGGRGGSWSGKETGETLSKYRVVFVTFLVTVQSALLSCLYGTDTPHQQARKCRCRYCLSWMCTMWRLKRTYPPWTRSSGPRVSG